MTPEQKARVSIDALLVAAGWHVCNVSDANIHAGSGEAKGVAIREFPLNAALAATLLDAKVQTFPVKPIKRLHHGFTKESAKVEKLGLLRQP